MALIVAYARAHIRSCLLSFQHSDVARSCDGHILSQRIDCHAHNSRRNAPAIAYVKYRSITSQAVDVMA